MLVAEQLCKTFNGLEVLKSVSLSIDAGSFVAIVGPSGAGKSTLLYLLSAIEKPDRGKVSLMNTSIYELSAKKQAAFRNKHMGFVFQFHHLLPEFTALENVCMPLWIAGMSVKEAKEVAAEVLQVVGLGHRVHHKPSELSGGEQQRVAVARAIVHKPAIVFADEPTGNLDTANALAIHELFLKLRAVYNLTFVVVTHNEQLAAMADRTLHMKDGLVEKEMEKR
jgi:lipoprotein-releasing system ATP-binding protein